MTNRQPSLRSDDCPIWPGIGVRQLSESVSDFIGIRTGTKNWEIRRVPMIPDMRRLLERLHEERGETEFRSNPVIPIKQCQGAINSACRKLGIERFTHHDLRHLFATRCIESGVDIPTVSRWLGHKDGGALAMKTYGHLRDQHSTTMAQKVTFSEQAENIVPMPKADQPQQDQAQGSVASDRRAIAKAKAKYTYPWWVAENAVEIFWGQINEDIQIVSVEKFLEAAKDAMGREVLRQELADRQVLIDEFEERVSKETLNILSARIKKQRLNAQGCTR